MNRRLICHLLRHDWKVIWATAALKKGTRMYQCARCGEIGWRV